MVTIAENVPMLFTPVQSRLTARNGDLCIALDLVLNSSENEGGHYHGSQEERIRCGGKLKNGGRRRGNHIAHIGGREMYNWRKGIAQWVIKDTLYLSVVFTWDIPKAERIAAASKKKAVIGGPAAKLLGMEYKELPYSPLAYHNPLATFTSRGCPNRCGFCAVPTIEGDLRELVDWEPCPIICDNNLLACSRKHFDRVVDRLKAMPFVDFNQGLEAELFTDYHASRMAELRSVKVRFAFDHVNDETVVMDAIGRARNHGLKDIGVYVLIGFKDTPDDAKYRLELIKSAGLSPNPMRFQPLDAVKKNSYVGKNWTEVQLANMMKYYSRLSWFEHIPFEGFQWRKESNQGRLIA